MDTQFESRLNRKRRRARQDRQIESRRRINQSIELINSEAPRATFATARMSNSQSLLDELNERNKEEANLDARQKTGFILRLFALLSISVIDVLLLGAFLELFLRFQLPDDTPFFLGLKALATLMLVVVETKIAISIQEAKENASEFGNTVPLTVHISLGLIFAVAMTFCVLSLYYTKILNDTDGGMSGAQSLMLAAVGILTFVMHSLTVFDAEGVSGAVAYVGYAFHAGRLIRAINRNETQRLRTAARVDSLYRNTTSLIDLYTTEFPDEPVPTITLTPVAANLINAIQSGTLDQIETEQPQNQVREVNSSLPPTIATTTTEDGPTTDRASNVRRVETEPVTANADPQTAEIPQPANEASVDTEYYRNIVEAQIKDADGEVV